MHTNQINTEFSLNESFIYQTQNGLLISDELQILEFVFGSVFVWFLATSFQGL